jgi:hypothetical protein
MPDLTAFHQIVEPWLKSLDLAPPAENPQEVYSVAFAGELKVHVCHLQHGWIEVLADAGALPNRNAAGVLTELLSFNRFSPADATAAVGLDAYSGRVHVWLRHPLAGVSSEYLNRLVQKVQARVGEVRRCLDGQPEKAICRTATVLRLSGRGKAASVLPGGLRKR